MLRQVTCLRIDRLEMVKVVGDYFLIIVSPMAPLWFGSLWWLLLVGEREGLLLIFTLIFTLVFTVILPWLGCVIYQMKRLPRESSENYTCRLYLYSILLSMRGVVWHHLDPLRTSPHYFLWLISRPDYFFTLAGVCLNRTIFSIITNHYRVYGMYLDAQIKTTDPEPDVYLQGLLLIINLLKLY